MGKREGWYIATMDGGRGTREFKTRWEAVASLPVVGRLYRKKLASGVYEYTTAGGRTFYIGRLGDLSYEGWD